MAQHCPPVYITESSDHLCIWASTETEALSLQEVCLTSVI